MPINGCLFYRDVFMGIERKSSARSHSNLTLQVLSWDVMLVGVELTGAGVAWLCSFDFALGGNFMAVVHTDLYRHENLIRKSIQIPSTQHKELKALAVELDSSLGDVVETIMDLMRQDNYEQLRLALIEKREREISSLNSSLDEAYAYLGSTSDILEDAQFFFYAGLEGILA